MLLSQLLKDPIQLILTLPCILIALTFHEWAHGYAADKCGDHTARMMGRLSLNPMHHLDPIGAIMMLLVGFGWAKPVPVNVRNLRKPRRDFAIVAVAGPLMNFVIAFFGLMFATLFWYLGGYDLFMYTNGLYSEIANPFVTKLIFYGFRFFVLLSTLNVGLAVFNLIPLPPLDGSRVVSWLLPVKLAIKYDRIQYYTQYIVLAIVVLTWLPAPLSNISDMIFFPVDWLRNTVLDGFLNFWNWIFSLIWPQ